VLVALALAAPSAARAQRPSRMGSVASARVRTGAEEQFRIPVEGIGLRVFLRHKAPTRQGPGTNRAPVLFVHGASFPSALAADFKFGGTSWMDDLAARGFDVWALDFLGYGGSDRYPEMAEPAAAHPPLGRAPEAARQIGTAVEFITRQRNVPRVSLVAHSWGTIPAGLYAGTMPARVERLVQFGPVTSRKEEVDTAAHPAHWLVTLDDQFKRFHGYVPAGQAKLLASRDSAVWGPAYLDSDSTSRTRSPASVRVPYGPIADAQAAWGGGALGYDPARITAPVLIVRGEWDEVVTDADARWLWDALTHAPIKRDVKIDHATHVIHLETGHRKLWNEVARFLSEPER
jgi:pimeloyl-ACP methyl ester carboxylesterase